ncbi:MAG: hypothetical protein NVSMB45_03880 [Ginsengibacter sp.]
MKNFDAAVTSLNMIFPTKGIVLKLVKYGESSLIVTIFTERYGIGSYLINGIRTSGKASSQIAMLQPSSLLDLNVYHNDLKNLQRIKDYRWSFIYKTVLTDVIKNAIAMYMIELLQKCLKQPETNNELFQFTEDAFIELDQVNASVAANFPIYFCLHLAEFLGFKLQDNYTDTNNILDLQEGFFTFQPPAHGHYLLSNYSYAISEMLKSRTPADIEQIKMNKHMRNEIITQFQFYYAYHIQDFGMMKTLPVLQSILS